MLDLLLTSPLVTDLAALLVRADEVVEGPEPEDVKAGWGALGLFLLLVGVVVLLAFSLVKQLRKAQSAKDAGLYGDPPKAAGTGGAGTGVDDPAGAERRDPSA